MMIPKIGTTSHGAQQRGGRRKQRTWELGGLLVFGIRDYAQGRPNPGESRSRPVAAH
jgi:hypothetical protein